MSDVCLILEGTFPYVVGGVSSWVYDLIRGLPDIKFSVVHISPTPSTYRELKYVLPKNLVNFKEVFLFDYKVEKHGTFHWQKRRARREIEKAYRLLMRGHLPSFATLAKWIHGGLDTPMNLHDFVHSKASWDFLRWQYQRETFQPSFIDYFWTWRLLHLPLIQMLRASVPEAKVYHAVSTGYAGFLASATKVRTGRPLMITEHGIYTRERKIELFQAGWIYSDLPQSLAITSTKDFFRDWWIRQFAWMSRLTYYNADQILTLFERNRRLQIEEGAEPAKTRVVPNGVLMAKLARIPRPPERRNPPCIVFIGRVVPIKDVKVFIKAIKELTSIWPRLEAIIAGPTDEDIGYYQECEQLVRALNLGHNVTFPGQVNVETIYKKADIVVLTSISEGQPLVILEAQACGIPVVATDVGACRELLEGSVRGDQELGPSGLIAPIGDEMGIARAVQTILGNPGLYHRMSYAAKHRVTRYYRQEVILAEYQSLYETMMEKVVWQA